MAGSSVLGMLIPPSLLLIIYGVLAEQSIGKLFLAGLLPGVLMAVAFARHDHAHGQVLPSLVFDLERQRAAWHRSAELTVLTTARCFPS